MIQGSIHEEAITTVNKYVANIGAPNILSEY